MVLIQFPARKCALSKGNALRWIYATDAPTLVTGMCRTDCLLPMPKKRHRMFTMGCEADLSSNFCKLLLHVIPYRRKTFLQGACENARCSAAAGDVQALQETLHSTFARGSQQDMGFAGKQGLAGFGLKPGAALAAPLNPAAASVLQAASSRFSTGGTFEGGSQQAGGLSVPKKPQQSAPDAASVSVSNHCMGLSATCGSLVEHWLEFKSRSP